MDSLNNNKEAEIKKRNKARMEEIRAKREEEDKKWEDSLLAVHGAKIKFNSHIGEFKVLTDVPTTQGELTGTIVEKQVPNFIFDDGFKMLSLGDWQDFGTIQFQDSFVLLKKSTLAGIGKMPGKNPPETGNIEFINSGQFNEPDFIDTKGAPVPDYETPDFDIKLELVEEDFVPLGIPNFSGTEENKTIKFYIHIEGKGVNEWHFTVHYKGQLLYELFSATNELEEVIIKPNKKQQQASNEIKINEDESKRFWEAGTYRIEWDGFDRNGIYDSTVFTSYEGLEVSIVGKANYIVKKYNLEDEIKYKYKEVDWVDVRIDRNTKRIDTTLRVNLKDGGAKGLSSYTKPTSSTYPATEYRTAYDWEKVPKDVIAKYRKEPIKERTRSFEELEKLAIEGLDYHWGRNRNHAVAKDVKISDESFEFYMNAINTEEKAMNSVKLIYNTNGNWNRSGNPGFFARLSYNVGYIKYSNNWGYQNDFDEIIDFKETAAHEIGHPILLSFGNANYSWEHKGSSYLFPQDIKLTTDNDKVKIIKDNLSHIYTIDSSGEYYPNIGEIDLMKYYNSKDPSGKKITSPDSRRVIAAEKDILGLIWLSKIKLK